MTLKIIWSEFAETQLDEIYEYYEKKASSRIAKKLMNEIINEPEKLINTPEIGQEEELLKKRKNKYRYLVFKNYKLIYSVDIENGFINIADVLILDKIYQQKLSVLNNARLPSRIKLIAGFSLFTKVLADFLSMIYLLTLVLKTRN